MSKTYQNIMKHSIMHGDTVKLRYLDVAGLRKTMKAMEW